MRAVSLLFVAVTLASLSGCLLLHRPTSNRSTDLDTDLPMTEDSDPAVDDSDSDPGDTDTSADPVDTDTPIGSNQAPDVATPSISPSPAYDTSTLTCTATASDPDGTTPTVTYAWTNTSSGVQLGVGRTKALTVATALPGESVRCTATASDGQLTASSSSTVSLSNRAPVVSTPSIAPTATTVTSVLTCSATANDPDGTTPLLSYAWTNDTRSTSLGSLSVVTLSGATAATGDTIRCRVTASDGTLSSSSSVALTVGSTNRAPTVGTPVVTPSPAYDTSTLMCAATASDPDGTTPTVTYAWTNTTTGASLGAGASKLLTSVTSSPGDTVRCVATASDGTLTATSNASVTLGNRAPTVGTPNITPASPTTTATVGCAAVANDPDGATPTLTYGWTNVTKGTSLGYGASKVLSGATVTAGDTLRCTATASDGALTATSSSMVVVAGAGANLGTWESVAAGVFTMGCVATRDDVASVSCASGNEVPTHSVTLSQGFSMMRSEVTQAMWQSLMGSAPSSFSSCGATCPVENVNWWEAVSFANAASTADGLTKCYTLSGCTGVAGSTLSCTAATVTAAGGSPYDCTGYRLPTEAEWEYAARGGGVYPYSGGSVVGDVAWYSVNGAASTHPTCTKTANAYGLCDMSGNVAEWTWDFYGTYSSAAQTDPSGPASGSYHVYRGGHWDFVAGGVRSAHRLYDVSGLRRNTVGFRLVRSAP